MRPLVVKVHLVRSVINISLKDKRDMSVKKRVEKQISVQEAGRRGGQATLQNQGVGHFRTIGRRGGKRTAELYRELLSDFGKRGGRPRRPSLTESMEGGNRQ
jgi:general stress protein YciG